MDVEDPAAVKEPSIDLEDGELSSEEQEKASGDLDDKSATVHERSAPETPHTGDAELQDTADQAAPFNAGTCSVAGRKMKLTFDTSCRE